MGPIANNLAQDDTAAAELVDEAWPQRTAERKALDRAELAKLDPASAQARVTSLPPDGDRWRDVTPAARRHPGDELGD